METLHPLAVVALIRADGTLGELLGGASLAEVHSLIRAAAAAERGQPPAEGPPV